MDLAFGVGDGRGRLPAADTGLGVQAGPRLTESAGLVLRPGVIKLLGGA